ncbi:MAG: hypothetical protein R3A10_22865 [Caldilineaceae bacterium]
MALSASDGEKTIIWGVYQEPEILNPAIRTQTVANDVAKLTEEGLLGVDPDGNYYALLATEVPSPENGLVSDDGPVITYPLRDDVLWVRRLFHLRRRPVHLGSHREPGQRSPPPATTRSPSVECPTTTPPSSPTARSTHRSSAASTL